MIAAELGMSAATLYNWRPGCGVIQNRSVFGLDSVGLAAIGGMRVITGCNVLGRRSVAQGRVSVSLIMLIFEVADDYPGLEQGVPVVAVEGLAAQPVVERLDIAVHPR